MSDGDNEWNLIVLITFYMPISFIHWAWLESGLDDDVNNNSQTDWPGWMMPGTRDVSLIMRLESKHISHFLAINTSPSSIRGLMDVPLFGSDISRKNSYGGNKLGKSSNSVLEKQPINPFKLKPAAIDPAAAWQWDF